MNNENDHPRVGLGVIIVNSEGNILVCKRETNHAPFYSIPGGKLELGETFETGATREIREECNLDISDLSVVAVTNNLETYQTEGLHYISIILLASKYSGDLQNMEPHKFSDWLWVDPHNLPLPHFDASRMAVDCYLKKRFYQKAE